MGRCRDPQDPARAHGKLDLRLDPTTLRCPPASDQASPDPLTLPGPLTPSAGAGLPNSGNLGGWWGEQVWGCGEVQRSRPPGEVTARLVVTLPWEGERRFPLRPHSVEEGSGGTPAQGYPCNPSSTSTPADCQGHRGSLPTLLAHLPHCPFPRCPKLWARADLHPEADPLPAQVSAPHPGVCLLLPDPALAPLPPTCP